MTNRFSPLRWTVVTWIAVLIWCWYAIPLNIPPSVSHVVDSSTGQITETNRYEGLSEIPFPVGWPFHYVSPDSLQQRLSEPILASTELSPPGPSRISYIAMISNGMLILAAVAALIFLLQSFLPRFSLPGLLSIPLFLMVYFGVARTIAVTAGYTAVEWYTLAVFCLPIVIVSMHVAYRIPSSIPTVKQSRMAQEV